jgi:uncharacterized protein (DUF1684 family)
VPSRLSVSHASRVFATYLPLTGASRASCRKSRFTGLEELFGLPNNAEGQNKRRCMKVFLIAAGLALACAGCSGGSQWRAYVARITAERVAKDAAFKTQSEPIPMNLKDQLLPLVYYSVDPRYDVLAVLKPSGDAKALQMVYSDGAIRDVRRVGTLEFILNGDKRFHLTAFVEIAAPDVNDMFVPFGDLTNGTETYHGGRILDVRRTTNDLYFLDFNQAFNPSCYYSPKYSCPLALKENRLPIAVRAGEKVRAQQVKAASAPSIVSSTAR